MNEKACPICGKWFIDKTRGHNKQTCGNVVCLLLWRRLSRDLRLRDPQKKFNELVWMRIKILRSQQNAIITDEDIKAIYNKLSLGTCEICGKTIEFTNLCIDHNHQTHKIRGIICDSCNFILGFSSDNPQLLKNCIEYLDKYPQ